MPRTLLRGLTVAGIRLAIEAPPGLAWSWPAGPLRRFASHPDNPDVYVAVRNGRAMPPRAASLRYDSDRGIFDVAQDGRDWVITLRIREALQRVARFDESFRNGEVIVHPDSFYVRECYYPLAYPLDEVVFFHRAPRDGGILVHASGIVHAGHALLFTGPSGAGKTTLTLLALARSGTQVLSDDRIVLRREGAGFHAHGTPWHGEAPLSSAASAPLEAIHAIRHAPFVQAAPLAGAAAAAALLGNSFLPAHDAVAAERVLDLVSQIVARVPVVRLGFPKDDRVVQYAFGERSLRAPVAAASGR